ncbi:ribonuclease H-like domain-containing protein [Tanacetum coccineum]
MRVDVEPEKQRFTGKKKAKILSLYKHTKRLDLHKQKHVTYVIAGIEFTFHWDSVLIKEKNPNDGTPAGSNAKHYLRFRTIEDSEWKEVKSRKNKSVFDTLGFPLKRKNKPIEFRRDTVSVYVSNFSSHLTNTIDNKEALIDSLNKVWIRKLRLHANIARFDRKDGVKPFFADVKRHDSHVSKLIDRSDANSKSYVYMVKSQHSEERKDFQSIANLRIMCRSKGFLGVETKYLGGLWVLFEFNDMDTRDSFLKHEGVLSWFSVLKPWHYDVVKMGEEVIVMGDFNEVREAGERYGTMFNERQADMFNSFITNLNLIDVSLGGILDHCLILLKELVVDYGPNPFCFIHYGLEIEGFHDLVVETWKNDNIIESNAKMDQDIASWEDLDARASSMKIVGDIDRKEASDLAQKAKINWAIEGDENTSFFDGTLKKKRRQNAIKGVLRNVVWIEDPVKPNPCFHGHSCHISPLPKSPSTALSDRNGETLCEYNALIKNNTWVLVSKPPNVNVVRSMWWHKYHADGSLSRYKARLVANGRSQEFGVDCDDTFSHVVKPTTIRMILSLALSRNWPIHQFDVKNVFLNGDLSETVYVYQPPVFVEAQFPHHVCYAYKVGFSSSRCDSSLFIYQNGSEVAYLLIYVDDIVLTASSTDLLQRIFSSLYKEFEMTDLGALNYFLGISIMHDSTGMFLSQKKYALELLERAHMANCNPTRMPVDTESKLGFDGDPTSDPTLYRNLAGGLQYLTFTHPDFSYAVQQVCLHMHDPREPHLAALKRVLRYICGTLDFRLQLYASITGSLVAYTDADWAGFPTTRRSTSGYCVFLGDNILSWSAKRQHTLSRSSDEAEYIGVSNVVAETAWLRNLLRELHTPLLSATLVYCDNVRVLHVPSRYQYADIFTKGLPSALFEEFRTSLSVQPSPAQTAGEC